MSLRLRLALTIVAAAIPLVGGYVWLRRDLERRSMEDGVRTFVVEMMENGGRDRCEADPASFPMNRFGPRGPRRDGVDRPPLPDGERRPPAGMRRRGRGRPRLFAYYPDFTSANESAPAFPAAVRAALEDGADVASEPFREEGGRAGSWVGVRMDWDDGPCAFVLVRHAQPPPAETTEDIVLSASIMCGLLLFVVLLSSGPLVRRIRKLTADVRAAAAERYANPIDVRGHDEIGQLGKAFNEAGRELRAHLDTIEEREQTLRTFVANTTHDVMLPLTVLQGHLTELRDRAEAGEPADRATVLRGLEEAHYLASLVQNLNVAAKLEAGAPHVEHHPVDLNELVRRVVARHRPVAAPRRISVEFAVPEQPVWTEGDVTLIEQAVSNVVHNAVRYNREDGHVVVLLEEAANDRFRLRVIDDGPGIPPDELERITERRFRGNEARTRHPDGMGLGLHIAHDVAAKHGFDFELRPSEHGGLEVDLRGRRVRNTAETQGRR